MRKKNIAIIFGGKSSEHEVSRKSASTIIENISKDTYNVIMIGITKNGEWIYYTGPVENIYDGSWENNQNNKKAIIPADPSIGGIILKSDLEEKIIKLDAIIPVLHGKNGEDGTVQGLFTLSEVPFVGCDILSSAMCMDKVISNIMFEHVGLDQAKFTWFYLDEYLDNEDFYCDLIENKIGEYPIFVKPANAGSSVGITKVYSRNDIKDAVIRAGKEDKKILIEQGIKGREIESAVLGNSNPFVSTLGEIEPCNDFYDYDAKYIDENSKLFIPARIDDEIALKIKDSAIKAYRALGCSGLSRIDFFLEEGTNRVLINEINTFPGFTNISMYPMLMKESGYDLPGLIDKLICLAIENN